MFSSHIKEALILGGTNSILRKKDWKQSHFNILGIFRRIQYDGINSY